MLDNRKKRILEAIIEEYVQTAEPVSSGSIVKHYDLGCSSATIRNDMAELEDIGYLDKPHTSAGRIPSNKGYRFYVDTLLKDDKLTQKEIQYIKSRLAEKVSEFEELTRIATETLSEITNYTTMLINQNNDIEFNLLKNMFNFPEMQRIDTAQNLIKLLDEKEILLEEIRTAINEDIDIHIGNENDTDVLKDFSIITYNHVLNGKYMGTIGIIGPTRMNYSKVISLMKYIGKKLNEG